MDPSYESVVEPAAMIGAGLGAVIHVVFVAAQLALAFFLLASGLLGLAFPDREAPWSRRLGATHAGATDARRFGAVRALLGVSLLLPVLAGAPFFVSLAASIATLLLLLHFERGIEDRARGRFARTLAILAAAGLAGFALWEREDPLELGVAIAVNTIEWRNAELEWQLDHDRRAPKVGDPAPDFELQDPGGETAVRLSDFRDERPVALIFGSYT